VLDLVSLKLEYASSSAVDC